LLIGAVLIVTPYVAGGQSTTADEGISRDCPNSSEGQKNKGCYYANFICPHLTSEERAFKDKLSLLANHPAGMTNSDLIRTLGRDPDMEIHLVAGIEHYHWRNFGPG
ncbi:hypothetical protein LLG90_26380, partial [Aromatoleum toluclasticum]|uniref:hypothetical protein n=1 Tax=Aromatoleum toluclasticum TaxID=92003 RepID=UPI001D18EB87